MAVKDHCPPIPVLTFTQGFICGQAVIIGLVLLFIRYVVFEDPRPHIQAVRSKKRSVIPTSTTAPKATPKRSHHRRESSLDQSPDFAILDKLNYDLASESAESSNWLNVMIAQVIASYRNVIISADEMETGGAKGFASKMLNARMPPEESSGFVSLDRINICDINLGESYPTISNARVRPSSEPGRLRIEVDVDYIDGVSITVDTKVFLNFPQPKFAILPVTLGLRLVQFSATATIEILQVSQDSPPSVRISLYPDFVLEMECTSLIGSRAKLENIPKIEQLLVNRIRAVITEKLVWPRQHNFNLPDLGTSVSLAGKDFIMVEHTSTIAAEIDRSEHIASPTTDSTARSEESVQQQQQFQTSPHSRKLSPAGTFDFPSDAFQQHQPRPQTKIAPKLRHVPSQEEHFSDPWNDYSLPGNLSDARSIPKQTRKPSLGPSYMRNRAAVATSVNSAR